MRSKAPLTLMEQVMMVLVFALAAALCVQVFVFSGQTSRRNEARDRAVLEAQNAAETLKAIGGNGGDMGHVLAEAAEVLGGEMSQGLLWLDYDENWQPVHGEDAARNGVYRLTAQGTPTEVEGLWKAAVMMDTDNGEDVLFQLEVAWQAEVDHG